MSLVLAGVEVAAVGLKDQVSIPMYLQQGEEEKKEKKRNGFFIEDKVEQESSETSSIGVQSSDSSSEKDGEGKEEEEVQSKVKDGALSSLNSLEESLPIKRGLSNFYSGKSKSFASLADVATAAAKDLVKPENPFNKRRRLVMASKSRSYTSLVVASLPPLLSADHHIAEEEEEEDDERNSTGDSSALQLAPLPPHGRHITKAFRSPRSFSLSDLQNV